MPIPPSEPTRHRGGGIHFLAVLTALATLPLIFVGGLVTSHDAALAVPDWPTSFGYNMFFFPWDKWVGGIRYEHPHRLLGSLLGFLVIGLTFWILARETQRKHLRMVVLTSLAAVILQGVLGGYRVIALLKPLAIFHACLAQLVFCVLSAIALATSPWWQRQSAAQCQPDRSSLRTWSVLVTVLVFIQLLLGATMRHTGAGLAVPDFPWFYGRVIPPMDTFSLEQINDQRIWRWGLDPVSLPQIAIHVAHRIWAAVVAAGVIGLATLIWRRHWNQRALRIPAMVLVGLLGLQLALGIIVIWTQKAADIATTHVAVGALMLATGFLLTLVTFKRFNPVAQQTAAPLTIREGVTV